MGDWGARIFGKVVDSKAGSDKLQFEPGVSGGAKKFFKKLMEAHRKDTIADLKVSQMVKSRTSSATI